MATLTVIPIKDNLLNSGGATSNYGTLTYMYLSAWSGGDIRSILSFDISSLPAGVTINSATLSTYYQSALAGNPAGRTVLLYKVRRNDWEEEQSTWNIFKTSNNWGTAGASNTTTDIDTSLSNSITMPAAGNWMNFDVKDIVENAIANSVNVNVLLRFETEGGVDNTARLWSREYTGDTSLRPKLVIEYTSGTNMQVNVGGTMKSVSAAQINVGGNWKNVVGKQVNVNNTWKNI